ncbi:general substrate transporter [Pyronema omphalodes]|nr:general substrate transporter [Pyronema omphalodes]
MAEHKYLLYTVGVISMATFQFGYNMAELNEPREAMTCPESNGSRASGLLPECLEMADWQYGLATSIFAIGGLFGALAAQPLGKRYGRRRTLMLNSFCFIVAAITKALATNVAVLTLGRLLSGLSSGSAAVVVPLYINEISPKHMRGTYGGVTQITVNFGILITQILGLFLSKPSYWRLILIVGAFVGAAQALLLRGIPESPKYLLGTDKQAAKEALARLRATASDAAVKAELEAMMQSTGVVHTSPEEEPLTGGHHARSRPASVPQVSTWAFLTQRHFRKEAMIVCGLMLAQQLTGINACILHGVSILRGLMPSAAGYINVIISGANLVVTLVASATLFDRVSHKHLLIYSMSGMATCAFLLSAGIANNIAILSAVALFLFVCSFSFGLGPLPWMVSSKVVDYEAVDAAQSSALVFSWLGTFLVAFLVPIIPPVISFIGFGCIGFLSAAIVWFGVPNY